MRPESDRPKGRILPGAVGILIAAISLCCSPGIPSHPEPDADHEGFSPRLAKAHFEALESLYPRLPGSSGDLRARRYVDRELRLAGARVESLAVGDDLHLIGEIEGTSSDVILLIAPLPSLADPSWIDDSGAAVLVELARVFAEASPPYSLRIVLVDTHPELEPGPEQPDGGGERIGARDRADATWAALDSPEVARQSLERAGLSLAAAIEEWLRGVDIRAIIAVHSRARTNPRFVRDLRSHPIFRDVFWQSAASLGFESAFPAEGPWSSPSGLHVAFSDPATPSMGRVLAIVDERSDLGEDARPGPEGVGPEAFDALGQVTLEGLTRLMRRFEKIDAFRP